MYGCSDFVAPALSAVRSAEVALLSTTRCQQSVFEIMANTAWDQKLLVVKAQQLTMSSKCRFVTISKCGFNTHCKSFCQLNRCFDHEARAEAFEVKSDHAKEAGSRPDARASSDPVRQRTQCSCRSTIDRQDGRCRANQCYRRAEAKARHSARRFT